MPMTQEQQALRERFFEALVQTTLRLKGGPDPEVTLELLIDAAGRLRDHLEDELAELRVEQAE